MPRALLHVCNDLPYWNAHRRAVALYARDAGWEVTIATAPHPAASELAQSGLHHLELPIDRFQLRPRDDLRLLAALVPLLNARRFAAAHLFTMKPLLIGGLAARIAGLIHGPHRSGVIGTVAGIGRGFAADVAGWKSAALRHGLALGLGRTASALTFENPGDRGFFVASGIIDTARTHVLPGAGIDLDLFVPRPRDPSVVTVLFAGRLLRAKGVMEFIAAADLLRERFGTQVRMLVAGPHTNGDPDGLDQTERCMLEQSDTVSYLGAVPMERMPELMASADIFVLPTRYPEGLPRVLLEAAGTRAALIAGDVDGVRAFIADRATGLLLPRIDGPTIADAIGSLITDQGLRQQLGDAAFQKVTQGGYDIGSVAAQFLRLYDEAAGTRPTTTAIG